MGPQCHSEKLEFGAIHHQLQFHNGRGVSHLELYKMSRAGEGTDISVSIGIRDDVEERPPSLTFCIVSPLLVPSLDRCDAGSYEADRQGGAAYRRQLCDQR